MGEPGGGVAYVASAFQVQAWRWAQRWPDGAPVRYSVPLPDGVARAAVEQRLRHAIASTDVLRTTVHLVPGMAVPLQRVDGAATLLDASIVDDGGPTRLCLSAHPFIADEATLALLADRILFEADDGERLPTYADVSAGLDQMEADGELVVERAYWDRQLAAGPSWPRLPGAHPERAGGPWCRVQRRLTHGDRLRALGEREDITVADAAQAALRTLLGRLGHDEVVTLGVVHDARSLMGLEDVVGPLTQVLPIATALDGDAGLAAAARQVAEAVAEGADHAGCVAVPHDPGPMVGFRQVPTDSGSASSVRPPWCLAVFGVADDPEIELSVEVDEDVLDPGAAGALLDRWARLLAGAVANPVPLVEVDVLTDDEHRTVQGFSRSDAVAPTSPVPLARVVADRADRSPDTVAVRAGDRTLSYAALSAGVGSVAGCLQARGVRPGDRVGVWADPGASMLTAVLGVLHAGATYVPLDPRDPPGRSAFVLDDAGVDIVLGTGAPPMPATAGFLEVDAAALEPPIEPVDVPPDVPAYLAYTSGTTGRPKGVPITRSSLAHYLAWMDDLLASVGVTALPVTTRLTFDAVLKQLFVPLFRGADVWMIPAEVVAEPARLAAELGTRHGAGLNCVPSQWAAVLDAIDDGDASPPSTLSALLLGGEVLPPRLVERTWALLPDVRILNLYGPTETTATVTVARIEPGRPLTIGRPGPGTVVRLLDPWGQAVPPGTPGEIHLGGPQVATGYLARPDQTAERFVGGFYRTGDIARWTEGGELEYVGRRDGQVKVRGQRVELAEIEAALSTLSGVHEAAAAVLDGPQPQLVALVVPQPGAAPGAADHRRALAEHLPAHFVPSSLTVVRALPRLPNGKLDRAAVAGLAVQRPATSAPPRTEDERTIAHVWSELLDVATIGVDDDFFLLGGHSLLLSRVVARIKRRLDVEFPLRAVMREPTVAGMARVVAAARAAPGDVVNDGRSATTLRPGTAAPALVLVHPASGSITAYRALAARLDGDGAVIGIEADPNERGGPETVEALAQRYLTEVDELVGSEPCVLGGWSFGGAVAFEMAYQLGSSGRPTALVLVDSGAPDVLRVARFSGDEVELLDELFGQDFPLDRAQLRTCSDMRARVEAVRHQGIAAGYLAEDTDADELMARVDLFRRLLRASAAYRPVHALPVGAVLLRAADEQRWADGAGADLGWHALVPDLETRWVPGTHYSMFRAAHLDVLAREVDDAVSQLARLVRL